VFNQGGSRRMYYHINFTTKTKDNNDLLFFAETMRERDLLVVSCICRVNPSEGILYTYPNFGEFCDVFSGSNI
jgi:hypothetical protein